MTYEVVCLDSDEEAWRRHRFEGISASTLAGFLGLIPPEWNPPSIEDRIRDHADRIDSWERDLALAEASGNDTEIQRARRLRASTEAGKRYEGETLRWAAELQGWASWRQEHALVRHPEEPWFMATLDAVVDDGLPGLALAECKLLSVYVSRKWESDEPRVLDRRPIVPDYVRAQVFGQMFVTGAARVHVVHWYWGIEPRVVTVQRDDAMIAAIVKEARGIWDRVLARRAERMITLAEEAASL